MLTPGRMDGQTDRQPDDLGDNNNNTTTSRQAALSCSPAKVHSFVNCTKTKNKKLFPPLVDFVFVLDIHTTIFAFPDILSLYPHIYRGRVNKFLQEHARTSSSFRLQPVAASLSGNVAVPLVQCPYYKEAGTHFAHHGRMTGCVNPPRVI